MRSSKKPSCKQKPSKRTFRLSQQLFGGSPRRLGSQVHPLTRSRSPFRKGPQGSGKQTGMWGVVSRADFSSDGTFVLIVKGCPSGQPGEGDTSWVPAPIHRRILELVSVPERCLSHGRRGAQGTGLLLSQLFSHAKPPPPLRGRAQSRAQEERQNSRALGGVTVPAPGERLASLCPLSSVVTWTF